MKKIVTAMGNDILNNELKRIGQTRLIEINELINTISEIINEIAKSFLIIFIPS